MNKRKGSRPGTRVSRKLSVPRMTEIRPKRNEHSGSRGKKWIKQNEYDAVCSYLNSFSDAQLADFIKKYKPKKMPGLSRQKAVTHYYQVPVPLLVDGGAVHWIATAILQERKKARRGHGPECSAPAFPVGVPDALKVVLSGPR